MKRRPHIPLLLVLTALLLPGCRKHTVIPDAQDQTAPIAFAATTQWPDLTKALVEDASGIAQSGFVTWASWTDNGVTSNYEFGQNGTKVHAVDEQGTGWEYSPLRYWALQGAYTFAAAYPANLFAATYDIKSENPGPFSGSIAANILTLYFGNDGFTLGGTTEGVNNVSPADQTDLMLAFAIADGAEQSEGTGTGQVSLTFQHALSLVSVKAANVDPNISIAVKEIKVYGCHTTAMGATFTYQQKEDGGPVTDADGNPVMEVNDSWELSSGATSAESPYMVSTAPSIDGIDEDEDWDLGEKAEPTTYDVLVPEMLVFPENCPLVLEVTFLEYGFPGTTDDSIDTKYAVIDNTGWEPGKHYEYKIEITSDRIIFNSSVKDWGPTVNVDHTFE